MRTLVRTATVTVGMAVCLATTALLAQSEKISIRMAPSPGQTVRMTMTQDTDFEMTFDGASPVPGLTEPMKMQMRMTMAMTQKTGDRKPDGTVDAEISYDSIRTEISMNGQPMAGGDAGNLLAGRTIVVTYDRNGETVDIRGLEASGLTNDAFKQMMASFTGGFPTTALGLGETTSAPLDAALPLPLPGLTNLRMTGGTKLKLSAIDKDAQGRSARFESTVDGKMTVLPSPDGTGNINLDLTMTGDGTMIMDLDKGTIRSSLSTATFNGKVSAPPGAAPGAMPGMNMRGTTKLTITSGN